MTMSMSIPRPAHPFPLRSGRRAGFTLIELLAVILIIGILMTFLLPRIPEAIDAAKVTACKKNMGEIYNGLVIHQIKRGRAPNESGVRFFGSLIYKRIWENSPSTVKKLTCPGVDIGVLTIGELDPLEWFAEEALLDGTYSAYAGRDCKEYPLRKFPGSGNWALVADDNDGGANHDTTTVVLYADGSVRTYDIFEEREKGNLGPEDEILIVGPASHLEDLQKLSLD
jgi:prepilin-type N-terminal cleavage/methylation domain-containing protein